ncbi:hypothetical protein CDAR_536531 [Caerostris darwini]|uniref:Uncharacterized protein n=1 Tax=Caerostris darwini TaxID=1538125 RepID=A0AAV4V0M5_9ARAC|nr:hypothetical protein CDAR_536531 [Caerostris darwini]
MVSTAKLKSANLQVSEVLENYQMQDLPKSVKRSIGEILGRSSVRGTSSSAICQCSRVALHVVGYYVEDFRRED